MKRKCLFLFIMAAAMMLPTNTWAQQPEAGKFDWPYKVVNGTIKTDVPAMPAGQQTALGMVTPKMDVVRVAFVGLGMRGPGAVERWTHIPGIEIKALCDHVKERAEGCNGYLKKASMPPADIYYGENGYKELCKRTDIDVVYIATDWIHHFLVAKEALENGKHVAIEVPSAMNMNEIWQLINLSEQKRLHCMILENCCYDFFELSCLSMAQAGLFGEILHVEGSYLHNLDPFWDAYWNNWRLDFNEKHKGDLYATHGLGPVAQVLNIHRGDRFKTLVAMETKAVNGPRNVEKRQGRKSEDFQNGDETSTMILTEKGKTILIEHDVMTPRPYSRMYQLVGTDGYAGKYPVQQIVLRGDQFTETPSIEDFNTEKHLSKEEIAEYQEKYRNPILTPELEELAKQVGGHGGMDFIMDYRLIYCLRNGLPLDIDVYDMAEWCCLAELGEISIKNGNMPVEVPDFTRGAWDKVNGFSYAFAK